MPSRGFVGSRHPLPFFSFGSIVEACSTPLERRAKMLQSLCLAYALQAQRLAPWGDVGSLLVQASTKAAIEAAIEAYRLGQKLWWLSLPLPLV